MRLGIAAVWAALGITASAHAVIITNGITQGNPDAVRLDVQDGGYMPIFRATAWGTTGGISTLYGTNLSADHGTVVRIPGGAVMPLDFTTVITPAHLVGPNVVQSMGWFTYGANPVIWSATTTLPAGSTSATTSFVFSALSGTLDGIQVIRYWDDDVVVRHDDYFLSEAPDTIAIRDGNTEWGIRHTSSTLANATYDGFGASSRNKLLNRIMNNQNVPGYNTLTGTTLGSYGTAYGPADIASAMQWTIDSGATTATVTVVDSVVSVPEPSSLSLIAITAMGLLRRWK